MKLSERHHYLPEFYIKGFIGNDGKVAVFNKIKGRLESIRKSPKQIFYEWNRNTFEVLGKKTDFVEKLHQFGEDKFAPTYKKLTENIDEIEFNAYDIFHLMLFISTTHRRVPSQDNDAAEYLDKIDQKKSFFGIKNRITGEDASKDLFDRIINEPAFKESSKIIRSMEDYLKADSVSNVKNWKLSYTPKNSPQIHLLSDNPLILKDNSTSVLLNTILIFPLSKGTVAYNMNDKIIKNIPPEHTVNMDLLSFIQAEKLVCGPNGDYLVQISELAKAFNTDSRIDFLKNQVFQIFE